MHWIRLSNNTCMKNYGTDPLLHFIYQVQYLYYFSSISVVALAQVQMPLVLSKIMLALKSVKQITYVHTNATSSPGSSRFYNCGQLYPGRRRIDESCRAEEVVARSDMIYNFCYLHFSVYIFYVSKTLYRKHKWPHGILGWK